MTAKFAPIFSNHCILQREKEIRIFGKCDSHSLLRITFSVSGNQPFFEQTATIQDNHFIATFPPISEQKPLTISLYENDKLVQEITDVLTGEVFLAGGQSNMEFELCNDKDRPDSNQLNANVRYFHVPKLAFVDETYDEMQQKAHWSLSNEEDFLHGTAVGYHFAAEISQKLQVPVGIIGCNWGGTSASAWQDMETLASQPEIRSYVDEYMEILHSKTPEQHEKDRLEYLEYQKYWDPKTAEFYAANPNGTWDELLAFAGECKWPGPMGPKHEFRPAGLYETMLKTVMPYTLRGFLYYQGESDDHKPLVYETLLTSLISVWRRDFQDNTLPFLMVQLPMHRYANDAPNDKWCYIRKAQIDTHQMVPNTGLAVCIDQGEYNNIHPVHKKEVGHRLALQALYHIYHNLSKTECYGPIFTAAAIADGMVCCSFENAERGFLMKENLPLSEVFGFELSEDNVTFSPSTITKMEGNQIYLSCDKFSNLPKYVRYLNVDYGPVHLFGANLLPVAPFMSSPIQHP